MSDLSNCPNCGKLFVKAFRPVCEACYREVEAKFQTVYTFIRKRENRMASLEEVHAKTEVEKDLIIEFVRQGRLNLSQFPNLGYPCEKCETTIREGRLCQTCSDRIKSDLDIVDRQKAFEERKRNEERNKVTTYHSLDNRINRN
ncbi:TIGR03826 family flagellar region protein [Evansella halocellulosilytica]|uniref:TIGR03826 family flagellar region protein n=1 Tax=Evansella halocellulosilytica TaxID=2011013 RepID=UPI000BB80C53|nr:TIGR03826 family flagellar region protein [Evansella halocellulosilytica]